MPQTVAQTLSDPNFQSLPLDQKKIVLSKLDPNFSGLPSSEQDKVINFSPRTDSTSSEPAAPPEDRTAFNYAKETAFGVGRGIKNDAVGYYDMVRHPYDTAKAFVTAPLNIARAGAQAYQSEKGAGLPAQASAAALAGLEQLPLLGGAVQYAEKGDGRIASPESLGASAEAITSLLAPEAVGPITRGLADTAKSAREGSLRAITNTGPRATREIVENLAKKNESISADNAHAEKIASVRNQERQAAHKEAVQSAIHDTKGREITYQQELQAKADEIRAKQVADAEAMRREHETAVQQVAEKNKQELQAAKDKTEASQKDYFQRKAEHEAGVAGAEADNQRLQEDHQKAVQAQKELQQRLNTNERQAKVDLKTLEDRVHTDADNEYERLKPALKGLAAEPAAMTNIQEIAASSVEQAYGEPPLLAKFNQLMRNGKPMTYGDLDGIRSQIGAAFRKGGLTGNAYTVYERMLDGDPDIEGSGIINEMTRLAEKRGLGEAAAHARASWRGWSESFRDKFSPLREILHNPEQHGLLKAMRGQHSYLERLRSFGQDGQAIASLIQSDLEAARSSGARYSAYGDIEVPSPKPPKLGISKPFTYEPPNPVSPQLATLPTKPVPRLASGSPEAIAAQSVKLPERTEIPNRPPPVVAEQTPTEVLTPEKLSDAKEAAAKSKADRTANSSGAIITGLAVYDSFRNLANAAIDAAKFNFGAAAKGVGRAGVDVASRIGYAIIKNQAAKYLESPKALAEIRRITPADVHEVMKLPPEQRAGFDVLLNEAHEKGVSLKPGVMAALAVYSNAPKGPKTQEIQKLADSHRAGGQSRYTAVNPQTGHRVVSEDGQKWIDPQTGKEVQ